MGGQTDFQVASNALTPYASQLIGQTFGHGEDKNTTAQMVSHAILGATLAYVNGGNPTAGGSAAVASEAAATYFANKYNDGKTAINPNTGKFDPNLLPEGVKTSIRDLTAAIGVAVGGTVGDSAFNAQIAGVVGQNAVENNEFSIISQGIEKKLAENKKKDEGQPKFSCPKGQSCIIPIPEKTMGEKAIGIINDLTVRQLAAALGADNDPLTGEYITPNERQLAKASMLSLGFSKTISGPIKLTDDVLVAIEKKYGTTIAESIAEKSGNVFSPSSKNPLAKDALPRNTDRLVLNQGKEPTCGHNSCAMVLDTLGKPVDVAPLINTIPPGEKGITIQELSRLFEKNNVDNFAFSGRTIQDLERYTSKGTPVIVRIEDKSRDFSHFVVVDGITVRNGQKVVAIRDPHGKSYFSPLDSFKKSFTGDAVIPRSYK